MHGIAHTGPNPLSSNLMTPTERRTELCGLLAFGLVRLHMQDKPELSDKTGESSLHSPPDQSVHATPTQRRTA